MAPIVVSPSDGDERRIVEVVPLRTEEEGAKAQAAPTIDERIASFMIEKGYCIDNLIL
jgi:hypothetical protein